MEITRDTTLGELLDVLEDMNWHTESYLLEVIMTLDDQAIVDMCKILVRHNERGYISPEDSKLRMEIYNRAKKVKKTY